MEEENLIPGAAVILKFIEACASGLDSLLKWLGNTLPNFLTKDPGILVLAAALIISVVVWAALNSKFFTRNPETFFRMSLPWYDAALLLGLGAAYPVKLPTLKGLGFLGWIYFDSNDDAAVTWFNFREWDGFFQLCLVLVIIGILFLGILFFISRGIRGLIGALSGLSMSFFLGFCLMSLHGWFYERVCINVLRENLVSGLLNLILGIPQVVVIVALPLLFLAFFMTPQMMSSVVAMGELERRNARRKKVEATHSAPEEDTYNGPSMAKKVFPASLRSPKGEIYQLNYDNGERAEYLCRRTGDHVNFHAADFEDGYPSGWNAY